MNVSVHTGLLDTFWWFPVIVFLTSLTGLFFLKNVDQSINFGMVCFILVLILLKLLRFY